MNRMEVGTIIKVVPDGRVLSGQTDVAQLSLVLMPDPRVTGIDLSSWPSEIAKLIDGGVDVVAARFGSAPTLTSLPNISIRKSVLDRNRAVALWRRIFSADGSEATSQLELLRAEINGDLTGPRTGLPRPLVTSRGASQYGPFIQKLAAEVSRQVVGARALKTSGQLETDRVPDTFGAYVLRDVVGPALFASSPQKSPGSAITEAEIRGNDSLRRLIEKLKTSQANMLAGIGSVAPETTGLSELAKLSLDELLGEISGPFAENFWLPSWSKPAVWPQAGAGSVMELRPNELTLAELLLRHDLATTYSDTTEPLVNRTQQTDNSDAVRRKFNGLFAWPSLASALGLIIDVELPWSSLDNLFELSASTSTDLLIGARFRGQVESPTPLLTATEISLLPGTTPSAERTYFGPASRYGADRGLDPAVGNGGGETLKHGFIDLTVRSPSDASRGRYLMSSLDTYAAFENLQRKSKDLIGRIIRGQPITADDELPELRTLGLSILDTFREVNIAAQLSPPPTTKDSTGTQWSLLFAEDLLIGYRFDLGLNLTSGSIAYVSLNERLVEFQDVLAFKSQQPARDDGYSRPLLKKSGADVAVVGESLFIYAGASLAIPTRVARSKTKEFDSYDDPSRQELVVEHNPANDLAVNILLRLPMPNDPARRSARGLAPLRFGKSYPAVGGRCCWLNGGGHSLTTAERVYRENQYVLTRRQIGDSGPDRPYVHRRYEEIPPPAILLPDSDRLVKNSDLQLTSLPGHALDHVVMREGDESVSRYLLPASTSIDLCEQHGVLDDLDDLSTGAFTVFDRDHDTGHFPSALGGERKTEIDFYSPDATTQNGLYKFRRPPNKDGALVVTSRGEVLRPRVTGHSAPNSPSTAYFPDPLAEYVFVLLKRGDDVASGGPPGHNGRARFWFNPRAHWPQKAVPLSVFVTNLSNQDILAGLSWRISSSSTSLGSAHLPRLEISVAAGQELELDMWCGPALPEHLNEHWLAEYISERSSSEEVTLLERSDSTNAGPRITEAASAIFDTLAGKVNRPAAGVVTQAFSQTSGAPDFLDVLGGGRIQYLSGLRKLKIVRPTTKPLSPPEFTTKASDGADRVQFDAIRVALIQTGFGSTATETDPSQIVRQSWMKFIDGHGGLPLPNNLLPRWDSEPNATRAFFLGWIAFDRASTRDLRCAAQWVDWVDDATMVKRDVDGRWNFLPPAIDQAPLRDLCTIKGIPNSNRNPDPLAELQQIHDLTGVRSLDFGDTRARRLKVSVVGHSRFDQYYPTNQDGRSATRDLLGPTQSGMFDLTSTKPVEIWVNATRRPAAPILVERDMLPSFRFESNDINKELGNGFGSQLVGFSVTLIGQLRVKLGRPWIDTGEGGLLGVVMAEQDDTKVSDDSTLETFLSRRGHDPKRLSGQYDNDALLLPRDIGRSFAAAEPVSSDNPLLMPFIPVDNEENAVGPEQSARVRVAGFSPLIEPKEGKYWFCDLPIMSGPSYWPYVRLALVRWQPHVIADHELSTPVVTWGNVPPTRVAEVRFLDADGLLSDRLVTLDVSGPGFDEAQFGSRPFEKDLGTQARPLLSVRLMYLEGTGGWTPVVDPSTGRKIEYSDVIGDVSNGRVKWSIQTTLPTLRETLHYGLILEEHVKVPHIRENEFLKQLRYACVLDFESRTAALTGPH